MRPLTTRKATRAVASPEVRSKEVDEKMAVIRVRAKVEHGRSQRSGSDGDSDASASTTVVTAEHYSVELQLRLQSRSAGMFTSGCPFRLGPRESVNIGRQFASVGEMPRSLITHDATKRQRVNQADAIVRGPNERRTR